MAFRKIIQIDENKCNGCGLCVPNCVEGAIQIIDGKAKLVKDSYCDGLGACLGHCPQDALKIITREADEFDEEEALKFAGKVNEAREEQKQHAFETPVYTRQGGGCPGSRMMMLQKREHAADTAASVSSGDVEFNIKPQLRQWPVQLSLVPTGAPYFENADLLVCVDCVPFAYPNFQLNLLKGKVVLVGCPKLDDIEYYTEKLTDIFTRNNIASITVAFMEVPCCTGIVRAVENAVKLAGKEIRITRARIGIQGELENV